MGIAKIEVHVRLINGDPAPGAGVDIFSRSEKFGDSKNWSSTVDGDGVYVWNEMNTGTLGNIFEFEAKYVNPQNGVLWLGNSTARIRKDSIVDINLREAYLEEVNKINLDRSIMNFLSTRDDGDAFLSVIKELTQSMSRNLAHSSIALSSYLVEGFIKLKMQLEGKWEEDLEGRTLGELINKNAVKEMLGKKYSRRVRLLNQSRIFAVHAKGSRSIIHEARMSVELMKDLAEEWFRGITPIPNLNSQDSQGVDKQDP